MAATVADSAMPEAAMPVRLRVVTDAADLTQRPVAPETLYDTAVLFTAEVAGDGDTVACVQRLLPWLDLWRDHPKWASGAWRCEVAGRANTYSTGELHGRLAFHTDMTRYVAPPAYTIVRCLSEDSGGGGANRLLHVADVIGKLRQCGDEQMLRFLHAPRTLHARSGAVPGVSMIAPDWRSAPARIFDVHAATEGLHLSLDAGDATLYDEFVALTDTWTDLVVEVALARHAVLAFSNHSWLHGRAPCGANDRVTEICLGNVGPGRSGHP